MRRVYLVLAAAVLCFSAETAFSQQPVMAPAILINNSHVNMTIDFGFIVCEGAIGDFVWKDLDGDGIQDEGEPPIGGAVVTLLDANGNIIRGPVTTNESGIYLFEGLCAGNYNVTVVPPSANYTPTLLNQGDDDTKDSDGS
ncbi:MAG TPA: SdrD B-like domain-containing protein [Methanothrix sp.]|nr:SdrD B-like domain-containing protein [Methanothrix sp.]HPJ83206.1 SdrD B-like domain-containing protein [Methanothrix sp.]